MTTARIPAIPEPVPALAQLELDLLRDAAAGVTAESSASARGYSVSYVNQIRGRAMRKVGARSMAEAVAAAMRYGLLR